MLICKSCIFYSDLAFLYGISEQILGGTLLLIRMEKGVSGVTLSLNT